jgi:hypothetical protein
LFEEVKRMSFARLGAVEDPMNLMATGFVARMLVRYAVRTVQLDERYPGIALPVSLDAMNKAAMDIGFAYDDPRSRKLDHTQRDRNRGVGPSRRRTRFTSMRAQSAVALSCAPSM